jgi:hypothetical protein
MIDTETLFLRTLTDIEQRLSATDPYEVLLIAGLIRKLLLDDHPLVDQVNSRHRLKLAFEITDSRSDLLPGVSVPIFQSVQDGLDPDTAPPFLRRQVVNRDAFLKTTVVNVNAHDYTVREIVLFEANVIGAIHAGAPTSEKERALHEIEQRISIGGIGSSLRQLKSIARVVLKTLKPLRDALQRSQP